MERNNIKLVVASGPSFIHLAKRLRIPITPDPSAVRNRMKHCDRPSRCAVYMMYTKCFLIAVCVKLFLIKLHQCSFWPSLVVKDACVCVYTSRYINSSYLS